METGIIRGDGTRGSAILSLPDAPPRPPYNAADIAKNSMAHQGATCNKIGSCNTLDHKSLADLFADDTNDLAGAHWLHASFPSAVMVACNTTIHNSAATPAVSQQHKRNTHPAVQRLRGGGDDVSRKGITADASGKAAMSDHVDGADGGSAATARGTNFTPGRPRRCSNCGKRFDSGNKLHAHLKDCSAPPRQVDKSDTVVGHGKRKHEPTQPLASAPETYEDAINAPKRRRFMHHGLAGDVEAVELDGTFFYDTTPRTHASPHRTWHRPRTPNAAHQASAATGSGHQASATNGSGHHEAPATTGPGHLASATISASTTAPASAASAQAPATSKPPATA